MPGGNFICYRCKGTFRDHCNLQQHYDKKKKCVPVGTVIEKPEWYCETCKTAFSNKSNYTAHLKTQIHERLTAGSSVTNNIDNSITNNNNTQIINNIQINLTPRDVSRLDYEYLPSLTAEELKKELGLDVKNLEETILNTFRALHTNASRTENHNILIESRDAVQALIYKADSWRLEDKTRAMNDCICQCAVHLLDLENTIKECLDEREFKIFSMYRDEIERESAIESDDKRLKSLLAKVSDILVEFSKERPQTVAHAKDKANWAAPLVYKLSQRFQEWLPGGKRFMAAWDNLLSSMG